MTRAPRANVEAICQNFKVHVVVDENNPIRLEQARLAIGILGRTFRNLTVEGVQDPARQAHVGSLVNQVQFQPGVTPDMTVVLQDSTVAVPHIHADFQSWAAAISTTQPPGCQGNNVLAALYAASLAAQHVFNVAFKDTIEGIRLLDGQATWDLITGRGGSSPPDAPALDAATPIIDVTLVGVGAVGQAICHALTTLPNLAGRIDLVDHEFIDQGNMERYLLATQKAVGQYKPQVARHVLASHHPLLQVQFPAPAPVYPAAMPTRFEPRHALGLSAGSPGWAILPLLQIEYLAPPLTYLGWTDLDGARPRRLVVAAVDSAVTRRDIQFGLHEQVMNVWTDSGDALNSWGYSIHRIGDQACMACQYHSKTDDPGTAMEFKARQVGWPLARVRAYLEDPSKTLTKADLDDLQRAKGFSDTYISQFLGQPLKKLIEGICGQGAQVGNDRIAAPPVPHVPVIVGIHATSAIILRAIGYQQVPNRVQGDSLRWKSTSAEIPIGEPAEGCLCQNPVIQQWYRGYWSLPSKPVIAP
jgi:hypothetical protein